MREKFKYGISLILLFAGCTLRVYQYPEPGMLDYMIGVIGDSLNVQHERRQQTAMDSLEKLKFTPVRYVKSLPKKILMIKPILVTCPTCGYSYSTIMQPHTCLECGTIWFEDESNIPPEARGINE